MKKSILGINISTEFPFVKAGIPLTVGQNGHPIAFESDSKPVAWWLVCAETGEEFELDTVLLQYVNGVTYYNADANLFDYLETQGVTLGGGNFYYKFQIVGDFKESNVFRVDKKLAATPPANYPDWNSDWSNDFNI
jgi:hypothetical protein